MIYLSMPQSCFENLGGDDFLMHGIARWRLATHSFAFFEPMDAVLIDFVRCDLRKHYSFRRTASGGHLYVHGCPRTEDGLRCPCVMMSNSRRHSFAGFRRLLCCLFTVFTRFTSTHLIDLSPLCLPISPSEPHLFVCPL